MVQKLLGREKIEELRQQFQSELMAISKKHDIPLTEKETKMILADALKNLNDKDKIPAEVRERFQNAVLNYFSKNNPERAAALYNIFEGKKYYEGLGLGNLTVTINNERMNVRKALERCNELKDEAKADYFRNLVSEIAENFRTRSDMKNSLGIQYSVESSDPAEILTKKTFNCFSGSIVLGQLIAYLAGEVDLESEVGVRIQQVASYTLGGKWDDAGHAIVRVDFYGLSDEKKKTTFFDPMNTVIARHEESLIFDQKSETLSARLFKEIHYRLGKAITIGAGLVETAKFQDRLFEMQSLDSKTIGRLAKMPPLFLSYFVNHMSVNQQRNFFKNFNETAVAKIQSPASRYRLAAIAASAFGEASPARAVKFGMLALSSLKEAIAKERNMLPLGTLLENTVDVVSIVGRTSEGRKIIVDSGVWAYLPYVASTSVTEISPANAIKARDFLVNFYAENKKLVDSFTVKNPLIIVNYCQGLLTLSSIGGRTVWSEETLNKLYTVLGIDRSQLVKNLKKNAEIAIDRLGLKKQLGNFLTAPNTPYFLERNALIALNRVLRGDFNFEEARLVAAGYTNESAVVARSVIFTFENLSNVLLANGPAKKAAKKIGLV